MTTFILRIALPIPLKRLFDYLPPQPVDPKTLMRGMRVIVPFQSRSLVGILIEVVQESTVSREKLKSAIAVLDDAPLLNEEIYRLCEWAAQYYHCALGEVFASALPGLLRKGKSSEIKAATIEAGSGEQLPFVLNEAQLQAVNKIIESQNLFRTFLLQGVTGSGKTEVYLQVIASILKTEKQVLVLVPEISLTPQTIEHFRARFSVPIVAMHSHLSAKERLSAWLAARSGKAKIVIGTRSAIFTPFQSLGLIIVDEEHDASFKQQDRFRYHARDLAIMRANTHQIPIVIGSATPSLESLLNAKRDRYIHLFLPERAGGAILPTYQLIDLRKHEIEQGLSGPLIEAMRKQLQQGNQVMLFLNRRGFAPVFYCTSCAWISTCHRCDTRLVYHRFPKELQCHHCDFHMPLPISCDQCKATTMEPIGFGTERLEETLSAHFPEIPIIRVDRDNTKRKGAMQALITQVHREQKAILLGTQMLAKGHHFPQVTLVGIVDADSGLFSADFRATEQMGQLLLQVAGRAGRAEKPGIVFIQTRYPDHPLLQTLIQQGYTPFSEMLLAEREQHCLPPFSYVAMVKAEAYVKEQAKNFLTKVKALYESLGQGNITFLGPVPAMINKQKGLYREHLLVRSQKRMALQALLKQIVAKLEEDKKHRLVKWAIDVDPIEVL